jgi:hypothetical protein
VREAKAALGAMEAGKVVALYKLSYAPLFSGA